MRKSVRSKLILVHTVLATFFLPVGIMFLITGALYTVDIKGSYRENVIELPLDEPLRPEIPLLSGMAERELAARDIGVPTGGARIRRFGTSYAFEWAGANRDVLIEPTDDPLLAHLVVKDTTSYRRFVQLHKAKGGWGFKTFAVIWSAGLLALFVTGFMLAWSQPDLRRPALATTVAGVVVFGVLVAVG